MLAKFKEYGELSPKKKSLSSMEDVQRTNVLFMYCLYAVHGSYDTIYIFKNYFATVFSVFSKISGIQTDSKLILKMLRTNQPFV